jgi:hypothetical protein
MWVELHTCKAFPQERVGCDGGDGASEQAPERVRAVAGQFHLIGDFFEGGLDPVAPPGSARRRPNSQRMRRLASD